MVGRSAKTYRIGDTVRKEWHILPHDAAITQQNIESCRREAEVYLSLGQHRLVAACLSIGPDKNYIDILYYPNGNLRHYAARNRANLSGDDLERWIYHMVESVAYIHSKGVRHPDLRLDQWLVDEDLNARLSDFNAAGFDEQPDLGLEAKAALGLEDPSHFLPRDPEADSTMATDLFALGSAIYELVVGHKPDEGLSDELIESLYREKKFRARMAFFSRMLCWVAGTGPLLCCRGYSFGHKFCGLTEADIL